MSLLGDIRAALPGLRPAPNDVLEDAVVSWAEFGESVFFECPLVRGEHAGWDAAILELQRLRAEIDAINRRLYHRFNNGVYRAGFATTQAAHERAVKDVFDSMEFIEQQLPEGTTVSQQIGGDTGDWEHDRRTVSRAELIGIMRPRVEEILEEVRARLEAAGFESLPGQQVVLTGGASLIPGLDGLAARILGQQVRLGRPMRVHGLPQAATGPGFASAVGLCLFAAHPQDEWWDFEIPADRYPALSLKRAVKWFKDNW